jgi:hypothetical protein
LSSVTLALFGPGECRPAASQKNGARPDRRTIV